MDGEFSLDSITSFVGPATGPRWLLASGFDRTLLREHALGRRNPLLLAGASAGALRFAAWLQPEPLKAYERLVEGYLSLDFSKNHGPADILSAFRRLVDDYIQDDVLSFSLVSQRYRMAIMSARFRKVLSVEFKPFQAMVLAMAFSANLVSHSCLSLFFERVVFFQGPLPPWFCLRKDFRGRTVPLTAVNFKHALLASSAVPLAMAGVRDIFGAPYGLYRDGALTDYHLNQRFDRRESDVTLLFTHDSRIAPLWFDKGLPFRRPPADYLDNLLMVLPSEEFLATLPGGRIPERRDFKTFAGDPGARESCWRETVNRSAHLGEVFLDAVSGEGFRSKVERLA